MTDLPAYMANVNSADTAKAFLAALHDAGLLFHPDESAFDCLLHHDLPKCNLMTINCNMAACFQYLPDPCETSLHLLAGVAT